MKSMKTLFIATALAGLATLMSGSACAGGTYDPTEISDHPLRYAGYAAHAYGKAYEYVIFRPINAIVSQPKLRYIFGTASNPKHDDYWGNYDLYQRYNY